MMALHHDARVLALPERLTVAETPRALMRFESELAHRPGAALVVDAGSLQTFDTSALAVLLALRRHQHAGGQTLRVTGWPQRLSDLAAMYGVQGMFAA